MGAREVQFNLLMLQDAAQDAARKKRPFVKPQELTPEQATTLLADWLITGAGTVFGYIQDVERQQVWLAIGDFPEFAVARRFQLVDEAELLRLQQFLDQFVFDGILLDPWVKQVLAEPSAEGRAFSLNLELVKQGVDLKVLADLGDRERDRPIYEIALDFLRKGAERKPERGKQAQRRLTLEPASARQLAQLWTIARLEERAVFSEANARFNRVEAARLTRTNRPESAAERAALADAAARIRDALRARRDALIAETLVTPEELRPLLEAVRTRAENFISLRLIEDPAQAARLFGVADPEDLTFVSNPRILRDLFITGRGLVPQEAGRILDLWKLARERLPQARFQPVRPSSFILNTRIPALESSAQAVRRLVKEVQASAPSGVLSVPVVFDGDTLLLSDGRVVRLIGVDAPELETGAGQAVAGQVLRLVKGKQVRLELDPAAGVDPAGRTLAYVFLVDPITGAELFLNAELLRTVAAMLDLRPNLRRRCELEQAAAEGLRRFIR